MTKRLKRPRDPISLAKLIGDIATGQGSDTPPETGRSAAAAELGAKGGSGPRQVYDLGTSGGDRKKGGH